jgi:hypothetical protein
MTILSLNIVAKAEVCGFAVLKNRLQWLPELLFTTRLQDFIENYTTLEADKTL